MDKAVLISIHPEWCKRIFCGKKAVEIRKTRPEMNPPFKCYVYCTKAPEKLITIIKDGEDWGGEVYHGKPVFITWNGVVIPDNPIDRGTQMVVGEFFCDEQPSEGMIKTTTKKEEYTNDYHWIPWDREELLCAF